MTNAATIVRFFADSGVLLRNRWSGSPAARPDSFHSTARRRRSVVPVVPSSGEIRCATAPGVALASFLVSHPAVTSAADDGPDPGSVGKTAATISPAAVRFAAAALALCRSVRGVIAGNGTSTAAAFVADSGDKRYVVN